MKKRQPNLEYDFESPQFLTHWFSELRIQVEEYIEKENIPCGRIGIEPAWHLSPYISLWAIESATVAAQIELAEYRQFFSFLFGQIENIRRMN